MEKVKITREQADLLDGLLTTKNVALILQLMADWKSVIRSETEMTSLHHWYINDTLTVSKALIIGYEVEETPEDKVKAYYDMQTELKYVTQDTAIQGIQTVLHMLNIKIEGIN